MKKTYTICDRVDGFGAQYQAFMSGIAYCHHMNYDYVHTPIKSMNTIKRIDWSNERKNCVCLKKINAFMGIPDGIKTHGIKIYNNIEIKKKDESLVHKSENPDKYYTEEVLNKIRHYYYSTEKPDIKDIDIAIHIRRGNVSSTGRWVKRYTPNETYLKIIDYLKKTYPNRKITIFSEGKKEDFSDLISNNVECRLNETIEVTYHSFVKAKVLVIAKSSFSYSAGLLNENIVYYAKNFWHNPLNKWKRFDFI